MTRAKAQRTPSVEVVLLNILSVRTYDRPALFAGLAVPGMVDESASKSPWDNNMKRDCFDV